MAYTFYHNPDGYNVHKDSGSNESEVLDDIDDIDELDTLIQEWRDAAEAAAEAAKAAKAVAEANAAGEEDKAAAAAAAAEASEKEEEKKADYYEKYNELASKYATGEEISIQYKNLSERALMRPINISFGITLLLYYIYDLAFNKNS